VNPQRGKNLSAGENQPHRALCCKWQSKTIANKVHGGILKYKTHDVTAASHQEAHTSSKIKSASHAKSTTKIERFPP
jgi:hypothetical protein